MEGRKEMFYLMMHSIHFIYGYMVSADDLATAPSGPVKDHSDGEETCCCHCISYSFCLAARDLLYAASHRRDSKYRVKMLSMLLMFQTMQLFDLTCNTPVLGSSTTTLDML